MSVSAAPMTIDTTCHLSDYTRKLMQENIKEEKKSVSLSVGLRHTDNYVIPMTLNQIEAIQDGTKKERTSVKILFTLEQLKKARRLQKNELAELRSAPKLDLESMTIAELARLYEDVLSVMSKKVAQNAAAARNDRQETKRATLVEEFSYPCKISYNEDLYCQKCSKRTPNEDNELTDEKTVNSTCSHCKGKKRRTVNVDKEVTDGRISFL